MTYKTQTVVRRVAAQSYEEGDCRIWSGLVSKSTPVLSYRNPFTNKRSCMSVRRAVLLEEGVQLPPGRFIDTTCGNPLCVERKHFTIRTAQQHLREIAKIAGQGTTNLRRSAKIAATKRAKSRIPEDVIRAIRGSDEPARVLAQRFGINKDYINSIRRGEVRKDYTNPWIGLIK